MDWLICLNFPNFWVASNFLSLGMHSKLAWEPNFAQNKNNMQKQILLIKNSFYLVFVQISLALKVSFKMS